MILPTSRMLAGLAAACLLVLLASISTGCGQKEQLRVVRWSDIPERVKVVGRLGLPLGELATVRGIWTAPLPQKAALPVFMVNQVNGRPLDPPAEFDDVGPVNPTAGESAEFTKRVVGDEWELRGAETGGFVGFSKEVWAETGLPPVQPGPHGFLSFQTRFCYAEARRASGSGSTGGGQERNTASIGPDEVGAEGAAQGGGVDAETTGRGVELGAGDGAMMGRAAGRARAASTRRES